MERGALAATIIVMATILGSAFMVVGLTKISTQGGSGEFTEATEEIEILQKTGELFQPDTQQQSGTTTLVLQDDNALSKENQILLLERLEALSANESFKVSRTRSIPELVATQLSNKTRVTDKPEQINILQEAQTTEVENATAAVLSSEKSRRFVSKEYQEDTAQAEATRAILFHNVTAGNSQGPQVNSELQRIQKLVEESVSSQKVTVTGSGLVSEESNSVITDSLKLVLPAALVLISLFVVLSYRSLTDILLGVGGLILAVVWTFGSISWLGISLTQFIIVVPIILLAVGVDFGIHVINRYREEDNGSVKEDMEKSLKQLTGAFLLVTLTTAIGFGSNVTSPLPPLADYGIAAAVGIFSTFFIFGVFIPAVKFLIEQNSLLPDDQRSSLGQLPILSPLLRKTTRAIRSGYLIIIVVSILVTAGAAVYGAEVSSEFTQDTFEPPEDLPVHAELAPEQIRPQPYEAIKTQNYIEDTFPGENRSSLSFLITGNLSHPGTLETFNSATTPPELEESTGPLSVINATRDNSSEYAQTVKEADTNGNGVPDTNLDSVYDPILSNNSTSPLRTYMTTDKQNALVRTTVDIDKNQNEVVTATEELESEYETQNLNASGTGLPLVLKSVSDLILRSVVNSLITGFALAALVLLIGYFVSNRSPMLGLLTLIPIVVSISLITATMRASGIPFNAVTSLTLSTALGLSLDYSIHVSQRFADDYTGTNLMEALENAVVGTGGAVTGSIATTIAGIGTLSLALLPVLSQFGLLIGLTIFYAYVSTILVMPAYILGYETLKQRFQQQ